MKKLFLTALKLSPIFVAVAFASANSAFANEINGGLTPVTQLSEQSQNDEHGSSNIRIAIFRRTT
ncbi:MAG: hypothetical protein HC908_16215, partial [Calothrix sp. SM1_7_51]|nr:hypothetical protein [Calothrix sp. SM1_7_51]